jgi:tetratricopeptide (TPR) repeat protein
MLDFQSEHPRLRRQKRVVMKLLFRFLFVGVLLAASWWPSRAEAQNTATNVPRAEETNSEVMRAYLQLQEQLHATQLAIQQTRQESDKNAAEAAQVLSERLQSIERALSAQRARELEAMQSSNRVMLTVAGVFAAVGFIAMLLMAYFQWRTVHGLAEISATLPTVRGLGPAPTLPALGTGEHLLVATGPAQLSSQRLLSTMEQLEKRILQLEHSSEPHPPGHNGNGLALATAVQPGAAPAPKSPVAGLLAKGQSLLDADQAPAALGCFEEALAVEPKNAEALVKKGAALERLQKLDEAIVCYDQALAADSAMTIAYLHKGGLYNRMERFNEALECYEKALHTQETARK